MVLRLDTIRESVRNTDFRLRDNVVEKAFAFKKVLEEKTGHLPFDQVIFFNIGDAHAAGQKYITFYRQVLSLIAFPELISKAPQIGMPPDVIERAQLLLKATGGGLGAYSGAQGLLFVRETVCKFIEARDGFPSNPNNILLTDGGYDATKATLEVIIRGSNTGIMAPVPQYPLYSALISEFGGRQVTYVLDDEFGFQPQISELERTLKEAIEKGIDVRAIIINNPGNPGGQMLSLSTIEQIVRFSERNHLVIIADEVYQVNSYNENFPFVSLKKVIKTLGANVELFSMYSTSKGFTAECGVRGGYLEMDNIDVDVIKQVIKMASVRLSPNTTGQIMMDLVCNPPKENDASFALFKHESEMIMSSLKRKASMITETFNKMSGWSCCAVDGSLFAFPCARFSKKAINAAKEENMAPDTFYAMKLLEETGVCVSSGNIFGQKEGTYHLRLTLMPHEEKVKLALERWTKFNDSFQKRYAD